jgi:hypothetical protein
MRNERGMIRAIVKGKSYRPGLTFDDDGLAAIQPPTLHVFGTDSVYRRSAIARSDQVAI